ncbi:MAG: hypothetical protein H0W83_10510 [Planctomycetes bacterium]|nr:hypothetical protein [Planctomycetota bacterium]
MLTERIGAASLAWLDASLAEDRCQELTALAESVADRIVAGGKLYVAGDGGFCDELYFRAGGFAGVTIWAEGPRFTEKDVVVIGLFAPNDKGARCPLLAWAGSDSGRFHGAAVILIANDAWPQIGRVVALAAAGHVGTNFHLLDTRAVAGADLAALSLNQMATVALAYAFEGELFAAVSRRGKTMSMLTSIFEPGGEAFDEKITSANVIADIAVAPVAAGTLARAYLGTCRDQVAKAFAGGQAAQARAAAKRLADCQTRGGSIWTIPGGHLFQRGLTIPPELSGMSMYGHTWEWTAPQGLRGGDTLFYIGYLVYPEKEIAASLAVGADAVVLSVDAGPADDHVTAIRTCWEQWDAVVPVPGYPFKMLPSSGVVLTPLLYGILSETLALLKH